MSFFTNLIPSALKNIIERMPLAQSLAEDQFIILSAIKIILSFVKPSKSPKRKL